MLTISLVTLIIAVLIALAVVFRRYKRYANILFSISLLATASALVGDAISVAHPKLLIEWKRYVFICESIMAVAWLLFSLSFARKDYWQSLGRLSKFIICLSPFAVILFILMPMDTFFYSPEFESEKILFLGNPGFAFNIILLFLSIVTIIHLEITLRSSTGNARWEIKYIILGVGAIIGINIFYYSHALLYRSINMYLLPVRTGVVLTATLLIGFSLFRHKAMDTEFAVSRKVLYGSMSLIIVGIYLLGLGIVGEGMRYFGPKVGKNITTFLGFVGAILVLVVIFSERLRKKGKVYINKHFFTQKYDYREQWLLFTQQISLKHALDELLRSIAESFQNSIGVKGVSVWLKERVGEEFRCVTTSDNIPIESKPDGALLTFLANKRWIIDVHNNNCREIVLLCNDYIQATQASLIVPLFNTDDLMGFILLKEGLAGNDYNYEDYDLLKTLARQTTEVIVNAKLSEELSEAKEMEAMGRLSSFILHDLKNATSMLQLIVQNAGEHMDNPDFQKDAIKAVSNSSEKIKKIIGKLRNLPGKTSLVFEDSDLGSCVREVIEQLPLNGGRELSFTELEPVTTRFDREEINKVIINLIINAIDATNNYGKVEVVVGKEENMGFIRVSDNGCGMSREFIDTLLFRPFRTTKKKGLGIGLYHCKSIVEAHSGTLKAVSTPGAGSDFFLYLPIL